MIREIFIVFLRIGTFGFGGPAAHIAMMREEVVVKRNWLTEQEFLDLIGASQLIPGPNSTELAIHVGLRKAGWRGLLTAGLSFILPAFLCVLSLAIIYKSYGELPELQSVLVGVRPVVTAIVMMALVGFRKTAVPDIPRLFLAVVAGVMALTVNEVAAIFVTGILALVPRRKFSISPELFFIFLKIGSVLFGSGYVLLAFLQDEFVDHRGWLSKAQLLDAVSVGQFTPGPVFTTATFIGYQIGDLSGAVLATIGIFLPAFVLVALTSSYVPKLRASEKFSHFLDGVNAASFSVMLIVAIRLTRSAIFEWRTLVIGLASLLILWRFPKFNSVWLIILGGSIGYIFFQLIP